MSPAPQTVVFRELSALDKYQALLFESSIGLWEWSRDTNIIKADRGLRRLYEVDLEHEEGGSPEVWYSGMIPEDVKPIQDLMDKVWKNEADLDALFRIRTQSGNVKYIRTKGIKIFDEFGNVALLVGLNWDVTRESTLKKDLAETKSFLENLINAIPDPIFVKNRNHTLAFMNHEFSKLFLNNVNIQHQDLDELVFSESEPSEVEETVVNRDGENRVFLTKRSLMKGSEGDPHLIGVMRDITEIKQIQKSLMDQSKLASLGEVSAGMAHEINNPLSIISGKMMLLLQQIERNQSIIPEKVIQACQAVVKNCHRIEKIVKSLNAFSRSSERDPFIPVSLSEIFNESYDFVRDRLEKHDVKFAYRCSTKDLESLFIPARPSEIIQVMINLILNSVDAIRNQNERWISIQCEPRDGSVLIDVVDSGHGIKPEIAKKMMDYFFTTKPAGQGTGLGLSLAQQIIQNHNGKIEYVPNLPNTTFRITLPLAKA